MTTERVGRVVEPTDIPFLEWLGGEFVSAAYGRSELRLHVQPHHLNSWDVSHGGVTMTLLDVGMAYAARSANPDQTGLATIEMKTTFVRPGQGNILIARGHCYHRSTTMGFCEGELVDDRGVLIAKSTGTFKYIKRP